MNSIEALTLLFKGFYVRKINWAKGSYLYLDKDKNIKNQDHVYTEFAIATPGCVWEEYKKVVTWKDLVVDASFLSNGHQYKVVFVNNFCCCLVSEKLNHGFMVFNNLMDELIYLSFE